MERLPKDLIVYLAMELELPEILAFCKTSKKTNERVCKSNDFWRNKIEKERPGLLEILHPPFTYREIYYKIYDSKFTNEYTNINNKYIVKGDFSDDDRHWILLYDEYKFNVGDVVWLASSNIKEIFPTILFDNKEDAVKTIIQEILIRFENDDIEINFDIEEKLEKIRKKFEENDNYMFKFGNFYFTLKKVKYL